MLIKGEDAEVALLCWRDKRLQRVGQHLEVHRARPAAQCNIFGTAQASWYTRAKHTRLYTGAQERAVCAPKRRGAPVNSGPRRVILVKQVAAEQQEVYLSFATQNL